MSDEPTISRIGLRSFRAKFVLVVGGAVLFDLLVTGGLALWNVQKLSRDATAEVGHGLEQANQGYIRSYAESTAARVNLLLSQVHSDVGTLAGVLQAQIDHPVRKSQIGEAMARSAPGTVTVVYDEKGGWAQNQPGPPSVVSVWGYLLDANHVPLPEVQAEIENSAVLDLVAPSLLANGPSKLQMYYIGPKKRPIFRTTPYTDQAQTFDKLYRGHNSANAWTFFFPGLYESWEQWARDPKSRPVNEGITQTAPYTDAITGKLIVSFFQPLWSRDRQRVAGVAGADITLDQMAEIVEHVKVAENGFGFMAMSDGNVVAINPIGKKVMGLRASSETGSQGVTGLDRSLRRSTQSAIANLPLERDGLLQHVLLDENGEKVPYLVLLKQLQPKNLWVSGPVRRETMQLGIVVPEREIDASLFAAQAGISQATKRILTYQILAVLASLLFVVGAVFAISKRITSGISALADAAKRIQAKDYSIRVAIPARDEVGEAGAAFNRMAEQISLHTENLEGLVELARRETIAKQQALDELDRKLEVIEQQRTEIRELSTPVLQVWDEVLALPIIGAVDMERGNEIMERLLAEVTAHRARFVILDVTGVALLDTNTASYLQRMVKATELLGASCILTGIRPAVALALVSAGADMSALTTLRSLREGLRECIRRRERDL